MYTYTPGRLRPNTLQVRSFQAKASGEAGGGLALDVVFSEGGGSFTRSSLRRSVQAALFAHSHDSQLHSPRWRGVSYAPDQAKPIVAEDAMLLCC